MKITFKIEESYQEILQTLEKDYENERYVVRDCGSHRELECTVFPEAIASVWICNNKIEIETSWSQFRYIIAYNGKYVEVTYEGSYRGLLEQNLLPKLTPTNKFLLSRVESSFFERTKTLGSYAEIQEKHWDKKPDKNKYPPHPHWVYVKIQESKL